MFYSMGISLFFIHSTVDGHDLILPFDYGDYCCYENLYKIICLNMCATNDKNGLFDYMCAMVRNEE